jgi:hypothetical protein
MACRLLSACVVLLALHCSACGPDPGSTGDSGDSSDTGEPASTGDAPACGVPPTPTFGYGARGCGGLGFTAADASIAGVDVVVPPPGSDDSIFLDHMTGWQPSTQSLSFEFALDGRSSSPRLVVMGPADVMQGVRGTLTLDYNGEPQPVGEVTADAAGNLEFALTQFGTGLPYTLVLTNWPTSSCAELRVELPC